MTNYIRELLLKEKIEYSGVISIKECKIINDPLYQRTVDFAKSVIVFLMPYYTADNVKGNISLYCVPKDYHLYFSRLRENISEMLYRKYPENRFELLSDHSPIDETTAACNCGLGIIGDNTRLINEKYGSFVFIGEIYTDAILQSEFSEARNCEHCGICKSACPCKDSECLSSFTQRKGELSEFEISLMKKLNTAWGCDLCQIVCPHNKNISPTPIEFFNNDKIHTLTPEILANMSKDELKERAFGWRGRKTIERNIKLLFDE